jgi:hypothetical protein
MATNSIKLLTGNSYPELARLVADRYVHFLPRDGLSGHDLACTSAHYQASTTFGKQQTRPHPILLSYISLHTHILSVKATRARCHQIHPNSITNGCTDSE